MELETAPSFFPSLQVYKGTSPVCIGSLQLDGRVDLQVVNSKTPMLNDLMDIFVLNLFGKIGMS